MFWFQHNAPFIPFRAIQTEKDSHYNDASRFSSLARWCAKRFWSALMVGSILYVCDIEPHN